MWEVGYFPGVKAISEYVNEDMGEFARLNLLRSPITVDKLSDLNIQPTAASCSTFFTHSVTALLVWKPALFIQLLPEVSESMKEFSGRGQWQHFYLAE